MDTITFGYFDKDEAILKETSGKKVKKQKKKPTGPKGDQPASPENKCNVKVKKEAVTNFSFQSLQEESTGFKLLVKELQNNSPTHKTQRAGAEAALMLEKERMAATLQQQQTTIAEAEKNISIKDEELKEKVLLIDEQKSKLASMASNLWLVEEKLKTRTKQLHKLLKDNANIIKQVELTEQAYCFLKNQMQGKVTQLESALAKAENDLDAKNVELEQERSCHTQTRSTLEAAIAQTQQALENLQAKDRQQEDSLPKSTETRKKTLWQRIKSWFTPKKKQNTAQA
ncbi:uncharacterized protein LOC114464567 [Gouania willdenowi]|uniref:uncharacterized protein LOC114464567 n=1 Tax=Gouania willdenowi TaxID=441366 RepID=UPI001054A4B9|nr:uncharacterized protein LOC114464567 [Gouania willdenowi]